jgi:hypothetical protein
MKHEKGIRQNEPKYRVLGSETRIERIEMGSFDPGNGLEWVRFATPRNNWPARLRLSRRAGT